MLLKQSELSAIQSGAMTVVFRRWRRPSVKTGGTLKTKIGLLSIERVEEIARSQISKRDAVQAGHKSLTALLERLDAGEGVLYRIEVRVAGADPRIELRQQDALSEPELEQLRARLERFDAASSAGPWTLKALRIIEQRPMVAARALAQEIGFDRPWLKINIRKLKNLGLTISHPLGYELSPLGKVVLRHLENNA